MTDQEKKFRLDLDEDLEAKWPNDPGVKAAVRYGARWAFQWFSRQQPKLFELLSYSDRYQISFQMWPKQYTIFIEKDYVELWSYGASDAESVVDKALEYLKRITRTP